MSGGPVRKAATAGKAAHAVFRLDATTILWILGSGIGLLPLALMALVALIVILFALSMFGATMTTVPDPSASGSLPPGTQAIIDMHGGNGTGTFASTEVPDADLVAPIKQAAGRCDLLTPIILAAQIEYASGFDTTKKGPEGRSGLSQLTPEIFDKYGEDDDDSGEASMLDAEDDIHAHARYFCYLAREIKKLTDAGEALGDRLTLTLMAFEMGLEAVKLNGGMPVIDPTSYPFQVRLLFATYTTDGTAKFPTTPASTVTPAPVKRASTTAAKFSEAQFHELFPSRNTLYSYAGLTDAMTKFPAFAGTGDEQARNRELAAFFGNIDHESGGLVQTEEIDQAAWGNYCDLSRAYRCPAGQTAYHGRGPIQLSWNYNYKAAGEALGIDLLNKPDLVKTDSSVAWQTALWFWMTQTSAGSTTAHDAINGGGGYGATIRIVNGIECGGGNPAQISSRVNSYQRVASILDVDPGDASTLTC
ncbi:glycoside hydrolase family 19 protein [Micromonospora sp. NPDC050795]|uniref:glycoside hydrolase family 19 protein n=1 Tax=Micromonospora sp. NPDC050795 TaxID=3364282 RepID=UPI0037B4B2C3